MIKKQIKKVGDGVKIMDERMLRNKIHTIRGQKVMLDYDLAEIYGYTTSAFNQQVARNIEKFDSDFMFQVDKAELGIILKSHFVISKMERRGGDRHLPYAFTEQGIYMLMTVLRGELAIKQSQALIRMFKAMKDYIIDNQEQVEYRSNLQLAMKVAENAEDLVKMKNEVKKIDSEMVNINKKLDDTIKRSEISPILLDFGKIVEQREYIFMNGEPVKASEAFMDLYEKIRNIREDKDITQKQIAEFLKIHQTT